jgi:hypothetical protein
MVLQSRAILEYKYGVGAGEPLLGGSTALFDEYELRVNTD